MSSNSNNNNGEQTNNHVSLLGTSWSPCGYCKGARRRHHRPVDACSPNYSIYVVASLTPAVYSRMIHNGWRRSGRVVYQPDNPHACCPQHTLRLPVQDFRPNPTQRKLQRRLESLLHPQPEQETKKNGDSTLSKQERHNRIHAWLRSSGTLEQLQQQTMQAVRDSMETTTATYTNAAAAAASSSSHSSNRTTQQNAMKTTTTTKNMNDHHLPHFKIQRYDAQHSVVILTCATFRNNKDIIEKVADQIQVGVATSTTESGTLRVTIPIPTATVFNATRDKLHSWWAQQQQQQQPRSSNIKTVSTSPPAMTVRTLPAKDSAVDARVHQLYWEYQTKVHKDPHPLRQGENEHHQLSPTPPHINDPRARTMVQETYGEHPPPRVVAAVAQFWDFLVASPLLLQDDETTTTTTTTNTSATFHQQYWMGDILIAVSVLDILAKDGVSSVYCFYDPTFPYALGSLTGLYEITHYTRDTLHLPWYYLGYYIQSCPKMSYKGDYAPSQLRCPATNTFVDLDTVARPKLEKDDTCVVFASSCPPATTTNNCTTTTTNNNNNHKTITYTTPVASAAAASSRASSQPKSFIHNNYNYNNLRLSIHGTACRFQQLPVPAQNELRPHIQQWVDKAGEDVASRCVLDFRAGGGDDEAVSSST